MTARKASWKVSHPQGVILCYSPERRGKMAAITRAVEAAHGEILIFFGC